MLKQLFNFKVNLKLGHKWLWLVLLESRSVACFTLILFDCSWQIRPETTSKPTASLFWGGVVNSATLLWKSALSQLYFFAGTRKPDSGGTYGERQRASRQSNFRKRQGRRNCRLLFCYILTPITVLIEPANVSMAKVVQIQSLLFVPLLLKFKAIILFAALLSLSLQWLSNPPGSNLTVLFFISIFSTFWAPQICAFSRQAFRDLHPNHWIRKVSRNRKWQKVTSSQSLVGAIATQ